MTQTFTQGEPSLVNDPIDLSSEISLSLPEVLSLPSTPSTTSQTSTSTFQLIFPTNLNDRYREFLDTNMPQRLVRNIFISPPLFGQHLDISRLHNWALNRLQNRHDVHKDIQEHNIQILTES